MGALVVDAQPLIAILLREGSAAEATSRLREQRMRGDILLCAVTLAEVLYVVRRRLGPHAASRVAALLDDVPIAVVDVNRPLATHAADLKARHNLGLGDAFAAALALATGSPLLTGDADFRALEEHGLTLEWVGGD